MDFIMKILVSIMIALAAVWCKGMPSTNTFAAVTNDWYNANFTNVYELVGGNFSLEVQATNAPAANTAFSIRGKNPRDGAALDRLVTDIDEEFRSFAWRIAQHETARWSRRGTYLFNQFNPISGRRGPLKELPNWGEPDGWGIGQIIWAGGSSPHGSGEL